jgi:hypothetical protein
MDNNKTVNRFSMTVLGTFRSILQIFVNSKEEELEKIIEINKRSLVEKKDREDFDKLVDLLTHGKKLITLIGKDICVINLLPSQENEDRMIYTVSFKGALGTTMNKEVMELAIDGIRQEYEDQNEIDRLIKMALYGILTFELPKPENDLDNVEIVRQIIIDELAKIKLALSKGLVTILTQNVDQMMKQQ